MKVAITQFAMSSDMDKNIDKADAFLAKAKEEGAELVLLPELFYLPYFCKREEYAYFDLAETFEDSRILKHYKEMARRLGLVLPVSFFEKRNNCYFNSLVVIDSDGSIRSLYRKSHIPTGEGYEEKFYFTPGNSGFIVTPTSCGKVGAAICWDQWFPETSRVLCINGAEILCFPTAIGSEPVTGKDSMRHWQNAMRGSAAQNITPLLASNRIGHEVDGKGEVTFYGHSFIADQHGELLAEMDEKEEGIRVVDLDLKAIAKERSTWGVFRDRRIDLYGDLLTLEGHE